MESYLKDVPASASWQARLWDAAFKDLPDDLADPQWTALVELIDLVQDEDFGRRLADQGRSYWTKARAIRPCGRNFRASSGSRRAPWIVSSRPPVHARGGSPVDSSTTPRVRLD
jgi:hypothetical protein